MIAIHRKLNVIMYHYVRDPQATRFPRIAGLDVDAFRRQVELVRQRYEMATFASAIEFLAGRYQPERDLCLLTFDDGLRDHYDNVFPILADARIEGLFFLVTACQEGWVAAVHKSHFLMATLQIDKYRQEFLNLLAQFSPDTDVDVSISDARRVYRWDSDEVAIFKFLLNFRLDRELRDRILDELFLQHVGDEREFASELYLSWDEARQMQEAGMLMGGHSHRHLPLATLDADQQRDDLATCARLLHNHLRPQHQWPFSYPYGKADSFDAQTINIARELGFAGSFATEVGTNQAGQDRFRIRRIDTKDITAAQQDFSMSVSTEMQNIPAATADQDDLVLLIPDGVGLRNFVLGPFVSEIDDSTRVHVLHIIPDESLAQYRAGVEGQVDWHRLVPRVERPLSYVLRNCLSYAQMYWVDNFVMRMLRRQPISGSWRTRAAINLARGVGRVAASPARIRMLDRLHTSVVGRSAEVEHYRRLLQRLRPSVLFCSNQRSPDVIAPVLAAKQLGIPSASFIYSWDNLTTKGRIAAPFDHFLVWSDHMRGELLRYYPDVSTDRIHVVGTPQFDVYADHSLLATREEFFHQLGADPERPLICYSGGDIGNSCEDAPHVRVLMELVRSGQVQGRPQVLLRPAPVDSGERYADVRRDFPELIYAAPKWLNMDSANWAEVMPSSEDIRFLANLTHHADVNVNFASTMTLDFAIHDRPVVNLAFDVSDPPAFGMPMWDYVQKFDHYRPVIELAAARFAKSRAELAEHVNAYLADPKLDAEGRRRFVELEVGVPVGQSAPRVKEVLQRIACLH